MRGEPARAQGREGVSLGAEGLGDTLVCSAGSPCGDWAAVHVLGGWSLNVHGDTCLCAGRGQPAASPASPRCFRGGEEDRTQTPLGLLGGKASRGFPRRAGAGGRRAAPVPFLAPGLSMDTGARLTRTAAPLLGREDGVNTLQCGRLWLGPGPRGSGVQGPRRGGAGRGRAERRGPPHLAQRQGTTPLRAGDREGATFLPPSRKFLKHQSSPWGRVVAGFGGQGAKKQVEEKGGTDLSSPCPPRGEGGKMVGSPQARTSRPLLPPGQEGEDVPRSPAS